MMTGYRLGPWRIWCGPPPIPIRTFDWHYQDDNEETRCGDAASAQACLDEIWGRLEEARDSDGSGEADETAKTGSARRATERPEGHRP